MNRPIGADSQPWPMWRMRLSYLGRVGGKIFLRGDATAIRTLMGVSSILFAGGLMIPDTFSRPAWQFLGLVAPAWVWALCFTIHAIGVTWRFIDPVPRGNWAFAIHGFGVALWAFYVGLTIMFVGEYTPSTAMEIAVLLAAFVSLCRIGLNEEALTP